jgi:hypothetical protein
MCPNLNHLLRVFRKNSAEGQECHRCEVIEIIIPVTGKVKREGALLEHIQEFDSSFLRLNLSGFGPFLTDFFQLFRVCDIPLEVTAVRTDIIIKCGNGNNADRDTVAAERSAFRHDFDSRIDFFGTAFRAFSLFQVNTSSPG